VARRRLTIRQRRRISDRHAALIDSQALCEPDASHIEYADSLGPEQRGVVITRFGKQADILPPDFSPGDRPRRANVRANLSALVAGDRVIWRDGNPTGVVEAIETRRSLLFRPDNRGNLRPVAANIDRIAIVIASEPAPHANLIDRYMVAAHNQGITPFLILNKADLADAANSHLGQMMAEYEALGYQQFRVSARIRSGLDALQGYLSEYTCVLVGQSGVGKSSLINSLDPNASAAVGELSEAVTKGRHTTTNATLFQLPCGGRLIDSPGIREFGLWHLDKRRVAEGFIEFGQFLGHCRFRDCQHLDERGCVVIDAVARDLISSRRLASYQQIVRSLPAG